MTDSPSGYVGRPVLRREDARFLRGRGAYLDDLPETRATLHMAVLRSPHAHARIRAIDTAAAAALPGVVRVATGAEIAEEVPPFAADYPVAGFRVTRRPVIAIDTARFVGDAVAAVLAEDPYVAEDALGLISVDYEPLPAVADVERALDPGAPKVHGELADNILYEGGLKTDGFDAVFEGAPHVFRGRFRNNRVAGVSLEARGCLAVPEPGHDAVTLWSGNQVPHLLRIGLARYLGWADDRIRVASPDVGGGFGPKIYLYPEELMAVVLARRAGVPVKWVQDRLDDLLTTVHARDQVWDVEMAVDDDGVILAVRTDVRVNSGAYSCFPFGCSLEPNQGPLNMPGPYKFRQFAYTCKAVATHTCPTGTYRGVSAPCGAFAMESLLDRVARAFGVDRAEIRRRNLVPPDAFPYINVLKQRYDTGSYIECLDRALDLSGYAGFHAGQPGDRLRDGKYHGIGVATVTELTGQGAARYKARGLPDIPGYDAAYVKMNPDGRVLLFTSQAAQGQGHETVFAQIVADELGIAVEDVTVREGDTGTAPFGTGTFASRGTVLAGGALIRASGEIRDKLRRIAGQLLEASADDIELVDGVARVRGVPAMAVPIASVAAEAYALTSALKLPEGTDFGLESLSHYTPPASSIANACHVACVAVDARTGLVEVTKYVVVHDCGRVVNPMLVEGQIQGGIAQGLGQVLFEDVRYDAEGQLRTATLMDYLLPTALDVPSATVVHVESPSIDTIGGFKGAGEGGVIGAVPAIACAVADALAPLGVTVDRLPLRPDAVLALIENADSASRGC
jgi:carbon-monoxide dehydrogenase large subunit